MFAHTRFTIITAHADTGMRGSKESIPRNNFIHAVCTASSAIQEKGSERSATRCICGDSPCTNLLAAPSSRASRQPGIASVAWMLDAGTDEVMMLITLRGLCQHRMSKRRPICHRAVKSCSCQPWMRRDSPQSGRSWGSSASTRPRPTGSAVNALRRKDGSLLLARAECRKRAQFALRRWSKLGFQLPAHAHPPRTQYTGFHAEFVRAKVHWRQHRLLRAVCEQTT